MGRSVRVEMKKFATLILSVFIVFVCVSSFSYWFYSIGKEDQYIQTLSWVVADKTIVVDPGHGGIFPGKVGQDDLIEKDINLAIGKSLAQLLSEAGATVIMTRNSDVDLVGPDITGSYLIKQRADLLARVEMAESYEADLYVSIHCNSIPSPKWYGAQTFYDGESQESQVIAKTVQAELIKQLKNTKREALVRKQTLIFQKLQMPAIIVEVGFLSNPKEAQLLSQVDYQQRVAFAIYTGMVKHFAKVAEEVNGEGRIFNKNVETFPGQ